MKLARWIFLLAGIYGIAILVPGFFLESQTGASDPPAITHPEFYYGFFGSALVWQIVFLAIWRDPVRLRVLMPVCVLEKLGFFAACLALYATGRMTLSGVFIAGMIDGVWMVLFALAWWTGRNVPEKT